VKGIENFRISRTCRELVAALTFLSASLLTSSGVNAQSPAADSSPTLKAEVQPLSFFVGQWNCEGQFVNSKKPIAAYIAIAADLDGAWLTFGWAKFGGIEGLPTTLIYGRDGILRNKVIGFEYTGVIEVEIKPLL
jgi:hypothetical protein